MRAKLVGAIQRLIAFDDKVSGDFTVVRHPRDSFTYEGARRVEVVVNGRTRDWVRGHGNHLYVWGTDLGPGSIVHADVTAPPDHVHFDRLRPIQMRPASFDLFLDVNLAIRGFLLRYRHAALPHFYVQPFWRAQP